MDDLKARAALKLGVAPDELHEVVIRDDGIWPAEVVVLYADFRKVKFPAAELPELPAPEKPAPVEPAAPARRGRKS